MIKFKPVGASLACLCGITMVGMATSALAAESCSVRSTALAPPVVELYTSEGCSSCPPANQWLSTVKSNPAVVALAFHVDYWDRLGWTDRFSSAAYTDRQARQRVVNGAPFSATPQVVVDGAYRLGWSESTVNPGAGNKAPVEVTLTGSGDRYRARISPVGISPVRLGAYWAVTQDDFITRIDAGENSGATLKEDSVVRQFQEVGVWTTAIDTPVDLVFEPAVAVDPQHPRHLNLVIVDAQTGKPVQAVKLGC